MAQENLIISLKKQVAKTTTAILLANCLGKCMKKIEDRI